MGRRETTAAGYESAMSWLNSRQSLGIDLGLERMGSLLASLGDPQSCYEVVHVAGSNGKGSVATYLSGALHLGGYRTGLYTSPHLVAFTERIRVDGDPIDREDVVLLVEALRPSVAHLDEAGAPPTFFEVCTAAAFTHFRDQEADWAVVEAGMGGRRDATNLVAPELAVITNVSLEHTELLGPEIVDIAREKAGIIVPGASVVTAARGEALEIIEEECRKQGAPLLVVGEDYRFRAEGGGLAVWDGARERRYEVGPAGAQQLENATVAIAGCDALRRRGVNVSDSAVREALGSAVLPGRLEVFDHGQARVVVDGAHNPAAAKSLHDSLAAPGTKYDLIVGFSSDKDWPGILGYLAPLARRIWAVPIRSPRSLDPHRLAGQGPPDVELAVCADFAEALRQSIEAGATDVLATGSLFLAGEARATLTGADMSEVGGRQ